MPKRLTLLRHAKSDWSEPGLSDFDRPLNKRGRNDAPRMGELLVKQCICPQLIISSDAKRARTTAELVAQKLGYKLDRIVHNHALYLAPPSTLLEVLLRNAADHDHVMVVAHNPGMTDLANRLSNARIDNLPTCGVFMVESGQDNWEQLAEGNNTFAGFFSPKQDLR